MTATSLIGVSLEGRYTLETQLNESPSTREASTWRGTDNVLARRIVARVVPGSRAGNKLAAAASTVGPSKAPALAPILDTVKESSKGLHAVIREWVDAPGLEVLLSKGLQPGQATTLIRDLARALSSLHQQGIAHGHLSIANVFIRPDGRVVLTDAAMRTALSTDRSLSEHDREADDLVSLSHLLHLCLTGTWPGDPHDAPGLPLTPREAGGALSPRQVRAGVPRELDGLWWRLARPSDPAIAHPITTAEHAASVLSALPAESLASAPADALYPSDLVAGLRWRDTVWGRRSRLALPWLILVALGITGWSVGLAVGALPGQGTKSGSLSTTEGATTTGSEVKPVSTRAFDPPPGDGEEDDAAVPLAHDGDLSTAWLTDIYKGSPHLGGIKQGVGLLVDLGTASTIHAVTLSFPTAGTSLQIRAANSPGTTADDYTVLASASNAGTLLTLHPSSTTPYRYWLIWLTSLPKVSGGYQGGISEFAFDR